MLSPFMRKSARSLKMNRRFTLVLALLFLLGRGAIHAQGTWGVVAGKHFFANSNELNNDGHGIEALNARSFGIACSDLDHHGSTWLGSLVWQRKEFHYHGSLGVRLPQYVGELDQRIDLLELTFAARIALAGSRMVFSDIEPVIDWRFAQQVDGIAHTTGYAHNDTIVFDHDHSVDRNFSGARLRIGFSGDVPIASRCWLYLGAHLGWGADDWLMGRMVTSWDFVMQAGVLVPLLGVKRSVSG